LTSGTNQSKQTWNMRALNEDGGEILSCLGSHFLNFRFLEMQ
jgi:hypothetical protein